jgi:hypothetical protein
VCKENALSFGTASFTTTTMRLLLPLALAGGLAVLAPADRTEAGTPDMASPTARASADTVREYRGIYETGFEVSWFHPCGAPGGDDRWWVTLTNDALHQRDSLSRSLTGQPRALYVRWRATVSQKMPAGAGHMGRGSRYMLVTEVLQLRAAEEGGCTST